MKTVYPPTNTVCGGYNNVNKHTIFCDVRKLFKDRSKSTKFKVMFLTSNKIEYC